MKNKWTKPTVRKIALKKITLTGTSSGVENTGVGGRDRRN